MIAAGIVLVCVAALAAALGSASTDRPPRTGRMTGAPGNLPDAPLVPPVEGMHAVIDETLCIGCVKCVRACPVDAILGAAGKMHVVIAQSCTGCGLCLPPCPVDCIELVTPAVTARNWNWPLPGSGAARI